VIIDIILTFLMFVLFGASVIMIPWVLFLVARALLRQAHRKELLTA